MERVRFYIMCAMGALVTVSALLLFGAHYWRAQLGDLEDLLPDNINMRLDNLTLSEIGAEDRSMTITAASALYDQRQDTFNLEQIKARIYSGPNRYDITAEAGLYEQGRKIINLTGHVQVADDKGGVLISEALTLKFEEGLLIGQKEFCYSTPEADLEGRTFIYRTHDQFLTVEGRTHLLF
jgi:LPS export ABC transporter protein LptC